MKRMVADRDSLDDEQATFAGEKSRSASVSGRRVAVARRALVAVGWLLAGGILGQFLTVGLAVFAGPGWRVRHRELVHLFEWLAPLAVVLAYVAHAERATKGLAWAAVVLLFVQYSTAGARGAAGRAGLAALHPVGAALLFWTAMEIARRARASVTASRMSPGG